MDEELRQTLFALGIRTAGAFAAFTAEDVERRWGEEGLAAWRLARGEDRRRPTLARVDAPRAASAELVPSVATVEPVLFLVRAALDRLVRELVNDGRAAATVAITLVLDDARGALPGARAHTITREIRLARPLARVEPLLERGRALLDRWPLVAPVAGVSVAVIATAPLTGEQGDLLEPAWRDPAAADAAFARLRAELGADAVVIPVARDEHRPENAGAWEAEELLEREAKGRRGRPHSCGPGHSASLPGVAPKQPSAPVAGENAETRRRGGDNGGSGRRGGTHASLVTFHSPAARSRPPHGDVALRQLEKPESVEVECENGTPRVLWWRGRRVRLERALGPERLAGDWWKDDYARDYWRCEESDSEGNVVLFHDRLAATGGWYVQGWYD
jgi:nucleotidyltransferase/DNA polymerase involved in DNA repair